MSDTDAVLFANEVFYRAFVDRDFDAMDDLWSKTAPVTCLHPGWGPVVGRKQVMQTWKSIIQPSRVAEDRLPHGRRPTSTGETATVVCFEEIDKRFLVATNVFVREDRLWKMVHHQSGPTAAQPEISPEEAPGPLN